MVGSAIPWRPAAVCCAIVALGLLAAGLSARAASIDAGSGIRIEVPLKSMKDLRDQKLVKQRFDYSCGAAALATVLRYGFGDEVTERDILKELFDLLPEDEEGLRRKEGFSLLDLQHVAQARGYKAQGFRLEPQYLAKLGGPVIVLSPRRLDRGEPRVHVSPHATARGFLLPSHAPTFPPWPSSQCPTPTPYPAAQAGRSRPGRTE